MLSDNTTAKMNCEERLDAQAAWADVIAQSEANEVAVMQMREGNDAQIDIAMEKTADADHEAAQATKRAEQGCGC